MQVKPASPVPVRPWSLPWAAEEGRRKGHRAGQLEPEIPGQPPSYSCSFLEPDLCFLPKCKCAEHVMKGHGNLRRRDLKIMYSRAGEHVLKFRFSERVSFYLHGWFRRKECPATQMGQTATFRFSLTYGREQSSWPLMCWQDTSICSPGIPPPAPNQVDSLLSKTTSFYVMEKEWNRAAT